MFVQDERGGKELMRPKGASGAKLRCPCATAWLHTSVVAARGGSDSLMPSTETGVSKFKLRTFGAIRAIV